ncbi:MAG: outer membrane protein [Chitinophagales bacterium]
MKQLSLLVGLLIISLFAFSQSDYGPGYIVKLSGDTIRGSIYRGMEEDMAKKIKFKPDNSTAVENFSLGEIFGYGLDNDVFRMISFQNTVSGTAVTDGSFSKLLVSGFYELYTFERTEHRYYVVRNSAVTYLLFNSFYTPQGDLDVQGNYTSRLQILEGECDKMITHTDGLNYDQQTISKFIEELDECLIPGKTQNLYHKSESKMEILAWVGGLPLGAQSQFVGSAWLRFSAPRLNNKTFLNIGLQYSHTVRTKSELNYANLPVDNTTTNDVLSVPVNVQFNFTTGRLRPYIYGGFSVVLSSHEVIDGESNDTGLQKSFGFTFLAGAGIEYRPIGGLIIKADYQYELFLHFPAIGIAYQFK